MGNIPTDSVAVHLNTLISGVNMCCYTCAIGLTDVWVLVPSNKPATVKKEGKGKIRLSILISKLCLTQFIGWSVLLPCSIMIDRLVASPAVC